MCQRLLSKRKDTWAAVVTVAIVLVLALPQSIAWLPANEILGPTGRAFANNVRNVTIQGWGFFTKSPRELTFHMYKAEKYEGKSASWTPSSRAPNNQVQNWFGLDRTSRLQEFDVSALTRDLEASDWTPCDNVSNLTNCGEIASIKSRESPSGSFELCGRYLVTKAQPVPWSYRHLRSSMPGEAVIIDVGC